MIEIAVQHLAKGDDCTLTGLDWVKSSDFQSRYRRDTFYVIEKPDAFSWFASFVCRDPKLAEELRKLGITHRFNTVKTLRIMSDGSIGGLVEVS